MRIGYLECFSGISGDMLLGALVDAGVPFKLLEETATALNVGARLEMRKVSRGGIAGTKVDVLAGNESAENQQLHHEHSFGHTHSHEHRHADGTVHTHEHADTEHTHSPGHAEHSHAEHSHENHRSLSAILAIIDTAPIADAVKARASRAFQLLGEAEARIHSMPVEDVHFHEVGAV